MERLLLHIAVLLLSVGISKGITWQKSSVIVNHQPVDSILWWLLLPSDNGVIACGVHCETWNSCQSFSYNRVTMNCTLFTDVFIASQGNELASNNTMYYTATTVNIPPATTVTVKSPTATTAPSTQTPTSSSVTMKSPTTTTVPSTQTPTWSSVTMKSPTTTTPPSSQIPTSSSVTVLSTTATSTANAVTISYSTSSTTLSAPKKLSTTTASSSSALVKNSPIKSEPTTSVTVSPKTSPTQTIVSSTTGFKSDDLGDDDDVADD